MAQAQQWYIKWSHTGNSISSGWHSALDGPFPSNEAPVAGTITIAGQTFPALTGPYGTSGQAQAFIKAHPGGPGAEPNIHITSPLSNPLAGIEEVGAVLKAMFLSITDAAMWRSIFYIALGIGLAFIGIRLWLGKPLVPKPSVVPFPV